MSPKQGDLIFIDAEPHVGHEEGGHSPQTGNIRRPMVVISNNGYNLSMGMVVCMPITSKIKTDERIYSPIVDHDSGISGSIITYQVPNYDFNARHGEIVGHIHAKLLNELLQKVKRIF
ncbi:type II toxin-antitoxin system PemK/MazF family toxin [Levilactobacillus cerevisiae]|uniref:type II toxin-antitoxin system PemK/MazF family toxin n=1 Tax=Levilactobacillus cerevisiae TaxID=1704076 RepID=UPI000F77E76D|nr:type II toxin-antitoxin system PemK/MazF family toxin [Levilactobacillus cerevisiae]